MYKIIGGDGKVYGPVSKDQIQQWVLGNRANSHSKVSLASEESWRPLGEFPELATLLPGAAPVTTPASLPATSSLPPIPAAVTSTFTPIRGATSGATGAAFASSIENRDYELHVVDYIGRAWTLVFSDFWLLVGGMFVGSLVMGTCGLLLAGPMMGGFYWMFLQKIRGNPVSFGDIFKGFDLFLPLFLTSLVSSLLIFLGGICCLIPGIYLAVCWTFSVPLVIDKKMDFWDAMELSRKTVSKHWFHCLWLVICVGLVSLLGIFGCLVGIFISVPIGFAMYAFAYEDMFNSAPNPLRKPRQ